MAATDLAIGAQTSRVHQFTVYLPPLIPPTTKENLETLPLVKSPGTN